MTEALKLITKMEFRERISSKAIIPVVDFYCYVSDLQKFIALCVGEEEWNRKYGDRDGYEYGMAKVLRSKALRPNFRMTIRQHYIYVYPKENLVVSTEVGIHYICQHIFDFLPYEDKSRFYASHPSEDFIIGKLFIDHNRRQHEGEFYDVTSSDILTGFMNTIEVNRQYHDFFSLWIIHRKQQALNKAKA